MKPLRDSRCRAPATFGAAVSTCMRSGTRGTIAVCRSYLPKGLPARIARLEVMPEFDIVLVLFPAKENFASADNCGKINQTPVEVFHLNLSRVKLAQQPLELREMF